MRKKDPGITENEDRRADNVEQSPNTREDLEPNSYNPGFTPVKNANASGLGSMGRSEEKLTDQTAEDSSQSY